MIPGTREMTDDEAAQNKLDTDASLALGAMEPMQNITPAEVDELAIMIHHLADRLRSGKTLPVKIYMEAGLVETPPVDNYRTYKHTGVKRLEFIYKDVL